MPNFLDHYFSNTELPQRKSEIIAYLAALDHLNAVAPEITASILQELKDQRSYLKLIASENFSSLSVQLAMGNLLTDKYCEGYPFHRFYAGCENVDKIEEKAVNLAKSLFGAEHAYVQPHSGADANLVAFWAILTQRIQSRELEKLGKKSLDELTAEEFEKIRQLLCNQTVMGLSLSSGGHLTHGYRHNVSAKMMRAIGYDVDPKTNRLDYSKIREIALREKPTILLAGYSAYSRPINFAKMREIADEVGAVLMVDMAHFAGLVAGGVFKGEENPIPFAHIVTSTTHKTLRGPRGGLILCTSEFADAVNKGCPLILGGPLPHVIAAKAIAFQEASSDAFKKYAHQVVVNAQTLADELQKQNISIVTGGTDNHLILVDLRKLNLTGRQAELALRNAGMTLNRNMIPFDPNGPWYTSGIRLGTPALTTLNMGPDEMREVGGMIAQVLKNTTASQDPKTNGPSRAKSETAPLILEQIRQKTASLLHRFPLYPEIKINASY